jgi:hypothetical protein
LENFVVCGDDDWMMGGYDMRSKRERYFDLWYVGRTIEECLEIDLRGV